MNWLEHTLIEPLGLALLHFLWQGAIVGLLYAASLPATRNATAHTRYAIAVVTMSVLAIAPVATFGLLLHAAGAGGAGKATALEPALMSMRVASETGIAGSSVMEWVVIAWLAGVVVLSARLLLGWQFLRRLRRSADFAAAESLVPRLQTLLQRLSIGRPVALAVSAGIRSPVVIGWLKPLVLLPPAVASGLPIRQVEMVLAHELAHVRRLDHLVNLCQTVVETVLFYHPVVRWVSRRIRVERENACDDLAVAATADRLAYVEMLASLEKLRFDGPRLALGVNDGQVLSRIRRLVERGRPDRQLGLTGPAMLVGLVLAAIGSLQFVDEEPSRPQSDPLSGAAVTSSGAEQPIQLPEPNPLPEPAPATARDEPDPARAPVETTSEARTTAIDSAPTTDPAGAAQPASSGTTAAAAQSEPPALPSLEAKRLPPVSEFIDRAAGRELAMVEQPAITAPELPELPARKIAAARKQEIAGGELIERIEPAYPPLARQRGVNGSVEVEFLVTRSGEVREVRVLDESPRGLAFAEAAREAIADWRFEPFRRDDETIERRVRLEVTFNLGEEEQPECRSILGSRIPRCR